ncbi:MAG: O-antigen ligase family protein [Fimbriimonadaceae bacterium]
MSTRPSSNKKLLIPAPYLRGEIRARGNVEKLFSAVAFCIFVIMPSAFIAASYLGMDVETTFVAVWLLVAVVAIYAEWQIKPKTGIFGFQVFALSLALIGVPGLYFVGHTWRTLPEIIAFVGVTVLRLVVVFIIVPRCIMKSKVPPINQILKWLVYGSLIITIASVIFFLGKGITPFSPRRVLFENWLHPNLVALFGCLSVYVAVLSEDINKGLKWTSIGFGTYALLMTQGRSAIVVCLAALIVIYFLNLLENPKKYSLRGFLGGISIVLLIVAFGTAFRDIPAVQNIEKRTFDTNDPTAGRLNFIEAALDAWQNSPIFGLGFRSGGIDNVYVTMLVQTGIFGLIIYLVFFGAIMVRAYRHFKFSEGHARLLGKVLIVMGVAIFLRGFAERTSFLQLTDLQSNAFCIAAGVAYLTPIGHGRKPKQEQQVIRPAVSYKKKPQA